MCLYLCDFFFFFLFFSPLLIAMLSFATFVRMARAGADGICDDGPKQGKRMTRMMTMAMLRAAHCFCCCFFILHLKLLRRIWCFVRGDVCDAGMDGAGCSSAGKHWCRDSYGTRRRSESSGFLSLLEAEGGNVPGMQRFAEEMLES